MEIAIDEVTKLTSRYATLAVHTDAARMPDDLANHMLGGVILVAKSLRKGIRFPAYGPLGDIIGPFVWCYRCGSITIFRIKTAHGTGYSTART